MIQALLYSSATKLTRTQDLEKVKRAYESGQYQIWVDLNESDEEELESLNSLFRFHPLDIEEVSQFVGVPKMQVYDEYVFLILHRLFYDLETEVCETVEFEVFFSDRLIVTTHPQQLEKTFGTLQAGIMEDVENTLAQGVTPVLLKLLKLTISDYAPVMEQWEEKLDDLEQEILKGEKDKILPQVLVFKKGVATFKKSLIPEREILRQLYEKTSLVFIPSDARVLFKSVTDDLNALLHNLESLRDQASSVFDLHAAMLTIKMTESSNGLNFVMQRLTIAATIFMPLTFIVGVYGMNFDDMPEFHWKGFYYFLWLFMLMLSGGMIYFFKRKKWL